MNLFGSATGGSGVRGARPPRGQVSTPKRQWTRERKVTFWTVAAGVFLLEAFALYIGDGLTLTAMAEAALIFWLGRHLFAAAAWMRQHRRKLARANLPTTTWRLARSYTRFKVRLFELRRQWAATCDAHDLLTKRTKQAPELHRVECTVDDDISAIVVPDRIGIKDGVTRIRAARHTLATGCGVPSIRVKSVGVGDTAQLTFQWTAPLDRVIFPQDMPLGPAGRTTFAVTENGVASIDMDRSTLIVATQGAGKSCLLAAIIADWQRRREWVDVYAVDMKRGQELGWLKRLQTVSDSTVRIREFVMDEDAAVKMVGRVLDRTRERQGEHGDIDMDDWSKPPMRQHVPTQDAPRIVVLIDELRQVPKLLAETSRQKSPLAQLISVGRSASAAVVAATQSGTVDVLGPVRDLFGQRIVLRTSSQSMTRMALGDDALDAGAHCHRISPDQQGRGYVYDDDAGTYLAFRTPLITDEHILADMQYGRPPAGMPFRREVETVTDRWCAVYILRSADGDMIYVGEGYDPRERWESHKGNRQEPAKWWWPLVDEAMTRVVWYESKAAAERAEEQLIKRFVPRGNVQHNGGNPLAGLPPIPLPDPVAPRLRVLPDPEPDAVVTSFAGIPGQSLAAAAAMWPLMEQMTSGTDGQQ